MKNYLLKSVLLLCLLVSQVYAQDRQVTGVVTDKSDGSPLPGVSVVVKGTKIGTQTSLDGKYSIQVPAGQSLVFTYVGYVTQTMPVSSSVLNITLDVDAKQLGEVVVTGYGVQQKREVTGSIVSISGATFEDAPIQSFDRAMQGRAAGVQVTSQSGQPGGGLSVLIRGAATINGGTAPLYIIDGVQVSSGGLSGQTSLNALSSINPNDIQSIEILKDAASASIYGSQAGNGVVIITTKRGKNGKTQIKASAQYGQTKQYNPYDLLPADQWFNLRKEAYENYNQRIGLAPGVGSTAAANATFAGGVVPSAIQNYDWYDALLQTGQVAQYDLSLNGGDEKTKFFISGSYNATDGTIKSSFFKRGTLRGNLDHKIGSKFLLTSSISLTGSYVNGPGTNSGFFTNTPFTAAYLTAPVNRIFKDDGTYNTTLVGTNSQNELQNLELEVRRGDTFQTVSNLGMTYFFLPELSFKAFGGVDFSDVKDLNYRPSLLSAAAASVGSGVETFRRNINYNLTGTFNYAKKFNEIHNFSAIGGFEYRSRTNTILSTSAQGFPSPLLILVSSGSTPTASTSTFTGFKTAGFLGSVKYDFKEKYLLGANIRYDGSSRFGADHKYGVFYGFSGGWRMNKESFMENISFINELKLRASYGVTGVQPGDDFGTLALFGGGGQYGSPSLGGALRPTQLPNPGLTWERSNQLDLGFDFSGWNNRVSVAFDVFRKKNTDLLLARSLPGDSGFTSILENAGEAQTEGLEVELKTMNFTNKNFNWSSNFNIGFIRSKLNKLNNGALQASDYFYTVGKPLFQIYTYKYAGVNPADGRQMFYDKNQNITYSPTTTDRQFIGDQNPAFYGGLTNTFTFKDISLDFLLQYQYGNESYLQIAQYLELAGSIANNQTTSQLGRWTTPGQLTSIPRAYSNLTEPGGYNLQNLSSRFVETASYIRLKQITLDYKLPASITKKLRVPSVALQFQAINLLTFTNYRGEDPENTGNNLNAYPNARTFTAGLNLQF